MNLANAASIILSCGMLVTSCRASPQFGGPLAAIAESVLVTRPTMRCGSPVSPLPVGEPPLRECRGTVGDTSVLIVTDDRQQVTYVGRRWSPAPQKQVLDYQLVLTGLDKAFGPGERFCLSDVKYAAARRWKRESWHILLVAQPSGSIALDMALDSSGVSPADTSSAREC